MRCDWAKSGPMIEYHDHDWGVPVYDDRKLFEMLVLEGAQAGLSWETVLRKREGYRNAFDNFDPGVIATYGPDKLERLLLDPGIVRNRRKVESCVRQRPGIPEDTGRAGQLLGLPLGIRRWEAGGRTVGPTLSKSPPIPALSERLSKDLRKRGFKFVGSTICYAFLQSTGLVNDHLTSCFRFDQIAGPPTGDARP